MSTLAMMPKNTTDPYFLATRRGAEEAAKALGVSLLWDGPQEESPARQHELIEAWTASRPSVIAVSASDKGLLAPALRRARSQGIHVVTWDADSEPDAREFFVNPATSDAVAHTLAFEIGRVMRGKGEAAFVTSTAGAANQGEWARKLKARLAQDQPGIEVVDTVACHESREAARAATVALLGARPKLSLVVGLCSPAVPGAAEAVKAAGRSGVKVLGLSTPSAAGAAVREGWVESIVMWKAPDLGYLTVCAAQALAAGTLKASDTLLEAGRLGKILVFGDEVRLGRPHIFTKANIDQVSF